MINVLEDNCTVNINIPILGYLILSVYVIVITYYYYYYYLYILNIMQSSEILGLLLIK